MCRDSEGTTNEVVTEANLQAISNQSINWSLKNANDVTTTDSNGYGQVVMISAGTQRNERLRLTLDNDFLAIRAGEAKRVVAPQNWCR